MTKWDHRIEDKKDLLAKLDLSGPVEEAPKRSMAIYLFLAIVLGVISGVIGTTAFVSKNSPSEAITIEASSDITEGIELKQSPDTPLVTSEKALNTGALDAPGYVTARRKATVSAEITGRLSEVLVEEGKRVEAGAIIARLDDKLARIDLELAKARVTALQANIASAKANLIEAENVMSRIRELHNREFSSNAALTKAQADVLARKSELVRAESEVVVAELSVVRIRGNLNNHVIRAPFSGIVIEKNAQVGEIVAPGSAGGGFTRTGVCTIVDMDSLEIEVDVNERYIGRVIPGQLAEARLYAYPDWVIPARVIAIVPTAERDRATIKVRVGLDINDVRILPDMGVDVAFLNN